MASSSSAPSSFFAVRCGGHKPLLRPRSCCSAASRRPVCANGAAAAFASVELPAAMRAVNLTGGGFFSGEQRSGRRLVDDADHPARGIERQLLAGGDAAARGDPVPAEKLDEWVHESVLEIVRNIGEAPFLVHVFANSGGSSALQLQRDAADAQSWPRMQKRWNTGAASPPDGVILVEELKSEEEEPAVSSDEGGTADSSSSSKTWGLLVQGRGVDCAACYILNTCRVRSPSGFCTHFCLARAKCFGETAAAQLRNSWLLGANRLQPQ